MCIPFFRFALLCWVRTHCRWAIRYTMDTSVYSAGLFLTGRTKDITKKTLSSQHYYKGHYYTLLRITTYLPIALIKKEILSFPAV